MIEEGVNFDLSTDNGFSLSASHESGTIVKKVNAGQCSSPNTESKNDAAKGVDMGWTGVALLVGYQLIF